MGNCIKGIGFRILWLGFGLRNNRIYGGRCFLDFGLRNNGDLWGKVFFLGFRLGIWGIWFYGDLRLGILGIGFPEYGFGIFYFSRSIY